MLYDQTQMCSECPFRAIAPPGWLGPWTPEQMEEMLQYDANFACHTDIRRVTLEADDDEAFSEEELGDRTQHCVGFLRYQNSLLRMSRDPEKAKAQRELKQIPDQPLIAPRKFTEHHTQNVAEFAKKTRRKK